MDSVKRYLNQPLIAGGVGLVAGIIFGLVVLGWWLFPVRWTDAMPSDLTHDYQVDFMRMELILSIKMGTARWPRAGIMPWAKMPQISTTKSPSTLERRPTR